MTSFFSFTKNLAFFRVGVKPENKKTDEFTEWTPITGNHDFYEKHYKKYIQQRKFHLFLTSSWITFQMIWVLSTEWFFYIFQGFLNSHTKKEHYTCFIKRLAQRLARINVLYVKIFQALALNKEWIDPELNNELLSFTDHAPYHPEEIDESVLREIADIHQLQDFENWVPKNAGMISLVFETTHKETQQKFIIKLKRKNIEERLEEAIDHLVFLLNGITLFSFLPAMEFIRQYKMAELVDRNIRSIQEQTDFLQEVHNMRIIKQNCAKLKYVVIPEVYENVTYRFSNAILMDYVDGLTIDKVQESDYEGFAKSVLKFGFVTSFLHGVTHGDLHSGNILFIKDEKDSSYPYKIGIIDFGILCNLDTEFRDTLLDSITNVNDRPLYETAELILYSGIIEPKEIIRSLNQENRNTLVSMISTILEEVLHREKGAHQYQLYAFLKEFDSYLSQQDLFDYGLQISDQYVKIQLVIAMAHGVTMNLCGDQYVSLADKVVQELFRPFQEAEEPHSM